MNVLLSNDDGITSPGLRALYDALIARGHSAFAVAPMRQQSGVSHAITVFEPLRIQEFREPDFQGIGVFGTPADCVKLGLADLAPWTPDVVMTGINLGRNVGVDVFYSGTIGAAAEGAHSGIASMALSHANWQADRRELELAAHCAIGLAERIDWKKIPPGRVINVNFPDLPLAEAKGARVCPQAPAVWKNAYARRRDPRGLPYWWMEGELLEETIPAGSDVDLLGRGYITITPLQFEHTDRNCLAELEQMDLAPARS